MTAARTIVHFEGHAETRELVVVVPLKVLSEANVRNHWAVKARRVKQQRLVVGLSLRTALALEPVGLPCVVTLTRLIGSGGRMLDCDNNVGAHKAVRDAVAECLGVDDGDQRMTWQYGQRRAKDWGVEIRIRRV
jgi:hypothetical protein